MRLFYPFLLVFICLGGCQPTDKAPVLSLMLLKDAELQLQLTPGNAPVETPLQLQLTANNVVAVNANLTGVSMYMGQIPLRFSQQGELWQAEFLLGACSDPDMLWQLELELIFADGEKRTLKQQFQSSWR
ncbi:MAG: hypothetical protein Q8O77_01390 [Rheinheimera sp.]|nr:hypothetical protein [Rheinheimera sp.]